mmetsp:Transcript_96402/g.267825  ORF Transcript_96402/g.267825 Transcript_96402/m.267825 type:complete len:208 (-) Transcript_96402:599-1222(-)
MDPCSRRTPLNAPLRTSCCVHLDAARRPRCSGPASASTSASASASSAPMPTERRWKASHSSCVSITISSAGISPSSPSSSSSKPMSAVLSAPSSSSAPANMARPGSASSSSPSKAATVASAGLQRAAQSACPKNSAAYWRSVGEASLLEAPPVAALVEAPLAGGRASWPSPKEASCRSKRRRADADDSGSVPKARSSARRSTRPRNA